MKALVLFSGGQDSTTCLGWALKYHAEVECIIFGYGQKHSVETMQAKLICDKFSVHQKIIQFDLLEQIGDSALLGTKGDISSAHPRLKDLPASFVPNRNALFLTIAHAWAQKISAEALITGMCETDYSGYPDCRREFISSIELSLNLGANANVEIVTPLMYLNKAQIFKLAKDIGWLDIVVEMSHTCYNGNRELKHEWGYGCGECPACRLRERGWLEYKIDQKILSNDTF